jgi:regulator of sigma E protease
MNTTILGGITFVLVFAGIILVHETGHFLMARLFHIEVDEFGFGFPPRLLKLFAWKGTEFTLNWIPLGGFVRLRGEDDPTVSGGMAAANPWKRIPVLVAGAIMNLVLAVVVYMVLISQSGVPDKIIVSKVLADSPAAAAGIQTNDIVTQVDGRTIHAFSELYQYSLDHAGQSISLSLQRGQETLVVSIVPRVKPPEGQGPMGVEIDNILRPASFLVDTVPLSFKYTLSDIQNLLALPGRIISGVASPQEAQLGGPRSIWNLFQQSVARDVASRQPEPSSQTTRPTNYTLLVIISLTTTVGLANLLPIPALDGGRIFMTLIELVIRRPIPVKYQTAINGTSFVILLVILGAFYIKDIINPVVFTLP